MELETGGAFLSDAEIKAEVESVCSTLRWKKLEDGPLTKLWPSRILASTLALPSKTHLASKHWTFCFVVLADSRTPRKWCPPLPAQMDPTSMSPMPKPWALSSVAFSTVHPCLIASVSKKRCKSATSIYLTSPKSCSNKREPEQTTLIPFPTTAACI